MVPSLPKPDGEDAEKADDDAENRHGAVAFAEADGSVEEEEKQGGRAADAGRERARADLRHGVHRDEEDEISRRSDDRPDGRPRQDRLDAFQRIRLDDRAGQQVADA